MTNNPKRYFLLRSVGFLLSLVLALPGPAFGLRQEQPEAPAQRAGLEEALKSGDPVIALKAVIDQVVKSTVGLEEPPSAPGPVVPSGNGWQRLRNVRQQLADLPTYDLSTAWVWGVLDLLLNQPPPTTLFGQVQQEYADTRQTLGVQYPDLLAPSSAHVLSTTEVGSVINFKITTPQGLYVLSVQTKDVHLGGSVWSHAKLPEAVVDQNYRLHEIMTNEMFPWDPPYHYIGSYLRGETDRFGDAASQEKWGIKPGDRKGEFQLFRVVLAGDPEPQLRWNDLFAEPTVGSPSLAFIRQEGRQRHYFVRDNANRVAATVVSMPPFRGPGAALIVGFPNGNAGIGLSDHSAGAPYQIDKIRPVTRALGQRGVAFEVTSTTSQANIPIPILDTIRYVREGHSWDEGRTRADRFREFTETIRHLPRQVRMELGREGISLADVSHRIYPRVFQRKTPQDQRVYIFRLTLDGYLYLVEMVFPLQYEIQRAADGTLVIDSKGQPLTWRMVVTTDFPALTPLTREQLFLPEVLDQAKRFPTLRERLEDLEFLAFQEFFAAGSHRFLQFFGRDTAIALRLLSPLLTPQAHEIALQSVLDRVSPQGQLPSVEELHDQVAYEFLDGVRWHFRQMEQEGQEPVLRAVRALHDFSTRKVPPALLKYGVPDVDTMLLPALMDYLRRPDIPLAQKSRFLQTVGRSREPNLTVALRNLDWEAHQAQAYVDAQQARTAWPAGLVGVAKEGEFGNWRDVVYGIGYGIYPADVNAELIPMCLVAGREFLEALPGLPGLKAPAQPSSRLDPLIHAWDGVRARFTVNVPPIELRSRLNRYLQAVSPDDRNWFLARPLGTRIQLGHFLQQGGPVPPVLQGGLSYFPVSLDRAGRPVPVVASDSVFELLDDRISPARVLEILTPFLLPYPVGLDTPAGFLVASPALSEDERLFREISRNAYGGSVIYGWQMEYLKRALFFQMNRPEVVRDRPLMQILYSTFHRLQQVTPPEERSHELWTWDVDRAGFRKVSFGELPGHNDEGNPVQLWSIASSEYHPRVEEIAQQLGLQTISNGELLDLVAQVRDRYQQPPAPPTGTAPTAKGGLEEKPPAPFVGLEEPHQLPVSLPRVAFLSLSLPPGGGGVNIVIANLIGQLLQAKYPMTVIGGQVIAMDPAVKRNPPSDNVYSRLGMQLRIIPELDLQNDIEKQAWEGTLDKNDFERRVNRVTEQIEDGIRDSKVVLIHQYMTMPSNPPVTEALKRLARKYEGQKRFIAWVHNALPGPVSSWPLSSITEFDPHMEYIGVSPQVRDLALRLFGLEAWPWLVGVIKNSISVQNFFDISPKVLDAYFRNELHKADMLLFYPARLIQTKEIGGAIASVAFARRQGFDVRLVVSTTAYEGKIPQEALAYYQNELVPLMERLGLTQKEILIYLHEPTSDDIKSQKEIRDWLILTDALMFSSQQETSGIPIKEEKLAGGPIFHTDLDVLNVETEGYPHVRRFPPRGPQQSVEEYGAVIAEQVVQFLHSERGEVYRAARRAQKKEMAQSLEAFTRIISSWLNVPPPAERGLRAGTRNFRDFSPVENVVREAAQVGYRAFEVNFEGFKPSDFNQEGRQKLRQASEGIRLSLRLTDFPSYSEEEAARVLQDAARFAMEAGAAAITVPVRDLTPRKAEMLAEAARWAQEEAGRRGISLPDVLFAVENAWVSESGEWRVLPPDQLNQHFAGKPIGVSVWIDPFRDPRMGEPAQYVAATQLKFVHLYMGRDFFQQSGPGLFEKAGDLLRQERGQGWRGDVIGQSVIELPSRRPGHEVLEITREREEKKAGFLNQLIIEAYLPKEASQSLHNTGDLYGPPSLAVAPPVPIGGLEETATETPAGIPQEAGLVTPSERVAGEKIQLPQGALERKVIFLGPDVATRQLFAGLALLRPASGERLGVVAFARDAAHKREIEAGLEEAGLVSLEPVVDVQHQYDGDLYAAVTDRQLAYLSRNVDVHVLFTFAGLEEMGRFLQIPDVSFRTWQKKLERQLEFQA